LLTPFNSVEWHPEPTFTQVLFPALLLEVHTLQPRRYTDGGTPKILRKTAAHSHASGRLDAVDRIGEHLKAILESLETWAELGISADFPREQ